MTRRSSRSQASQSGVALLEVLISLLIFSFGVLGLIGLQVRAISFSMDAEDRNRAALLANEIATAMWLSNSVVVNTGSGTVWDTRLKDPASGLPNGSATVTTLSNPPNSADITIEWTPPQRAGTTSTVVASSQLTTRVTLPPP